MTQVPWVLEEALTYDDDQYRAGAYLGPTSSRCLYDDGVIACHPTMRPLRYFVGVINCGSDLHYPLWEEEDNPRTDDAYLGPTSSKVALFDAIISTRNVVFMWGKQLFFNGWKQPAGLARIGDWLFCGLMIWAYRKWQVLNPPGSSVTDPNPPPPVDPPPPPEPPPPPPPVDPQPPTPGGGGKGKGGGGGKTPPGGGGGGGKGKPK